MYIPFRCYNVIIPCLSDSKVTIQVFFVIFIVGGFVCWDRYLNHRENSQFHITNKLFDKYDNIVYNMDIRYDIIV